MLLIVEEGHFITEIASDAGVVIRHRELMYKIESFLYTTADIHGHNLYKKLKS
jgi:hypothetical protein